MLQIQRVIFVSKKVESVMLDFSFLTTKIQRIIATDSTWNIMVKHGLLD